MAGSPVPGGESRQPDAKAKRYDRQLRIWGVEGQQRLEGAKIALLNAGPTGSETLKNLVLGGIGSFTIVDGAKVTSADLGNNFLVEEASLGQSRAKCVTALVQELNETVAGSYVEESPETVISSNPKFFEDFTLIIATQMREAELIKLDEICRAKGVKLLVARSYGLVGYMRASIPEHCIVDSKPDTIVDDLRLHQPFPELQQLAMSFQLQEVDDLTHKHIPFAAILIQAAAAWKQQHGAPPSSSKERSAFKESISSMKRQADGVPFDEENFDEAVKAAFHVWTAYSIPSDVQRILADDKAVPSPTSSDFWVMVAALKAFVAQEGGGKLPLEGSIPDMHAFTELYLQLQRLYRAQADKDVAAVEGHVRATLSSIGRPADSISRDTIKHFCKNARNLRVIRYRSLSQETSAEGCRSSALQQALAEEHTAANASLYVLLRATDRFHIAHGRYPGSFDSALEDDVAVLKGIAVQLLQELGVSGQGVQDDYVSEMVRFGASELHVVAAIVGGMSAQEAIKLITQQFVPFNGVLLYNAMGSTTSVLDF